MKGWFVRGWSLWSVRGRFIQRMVCEGMVCKMVVCEAMICKRMVCDGIVSYCHITLPCNYYIYYTDSWKLFKGFSVFETFSLEVCDKLRCMIKKTMKFQNGDSYQKTHTVYCGKENPPNILCLTKHTGICFVCM